MKRILASIAFAFLVTITCGQAQTPSPPGKLVDVGGHRIHLHSMGKGGPVVVLENGSFDFSFVWSLVQPEVAKFSQVVSYDRAGYAWSDPGPTPRTGQQLAYELHTALQNAGIKGPYILVGQSFGGFLVRIFARLYPHDVSGMVLVDALHEDSQIDMGDKFVRIREMSSGRTSPPLQEKFTAKIQKDSLSMLSGHGLEPPFDRLPVDAQKLQLWAQSRQQFIDAGRSEMDWSPEDVADMYVNRDQSAYKLGNIPLIVISRGHGGYSGADSTALENERIQLQQELGALSTNSRIIFDPNSGHNIHMEDPAIVAQAIKEVFNAVKNHSQLK